MTQEEYLENLSKDFTEQELFLLLNAVSVRSLDLQKSIWCCTDEVVAKGYQNMVVCFNSLAEKIKFKIDTYEKDKARKDSIA